MRIILYRMLYPFLLIFLLRLTDAIDILYFMHISSLIESQSVSCVWMNVSHLYVLSMLLLAGYPCILVRIIE